MQICGNEIEEDDIEIDETPPVSGEEESVDPSVSNRAEIDASESEKSGIVSERPATAVAAEHVKHQDEFIREEAEESLAEATVAAADKATTITENVEAVQTAATRAKRINRSRNPFIVFFLSMFSRRPKKRAADVARQAGRQWRRMSDRQRRKYAATMSLDSTTKLNEASDES